MSEKKLGMLIDLSLCVGCNACAVACKQENEVPTGCFNTWIESFDVEADGQIKRANIPKLCPLREGVPDPGKPSHRGRHDRRRPRALHRMQVLHGRVPLPGALPAAFGRGGEVHLL